MSAEILSREVRWFWCLLVLASGVHAVKAEDSARQKAEQRMPCEVREAWREPPGAAVGASPIAAGGVAETRHKLDALRIGAVSFHAAPLTQVAAALGALSRELEIAAGTGAGPATGVNVVVLAPGAADPLVSIALRELSLRRVLELVAESAGFQLDVADDVAVLRPASATPALATESFAVPRATVLRWSGGRVAEAESAKPGAAAREEAHEVRDETPALRAFLQDAGVDFAHTPGSGLVYDGSGVIVTQSRANLDRLRGLIARYRTVRQVEIEARFVEVQQGVLEEMGVQWSVARSVDPATGRPREKYRSPIRSLAQAFAGTRGASSILIDGEEVARVGTPGLPGAVSLGDATEPFAEVSGFVGEFDVSAVVRALAQKQGSDLLSAPRVTVVSGAEATITVAQELRYPRQFGTIQSQVGTASAQNSGSAGVTITAGTPQDFATQNVGVELRVRPCVEDDGTIALELNPTVTEFEGFVEYGGQSLAIAGGRTVTIPSGFFQPIFSRRQVRTQVVLRDGATLVMGGLTREDVKTVKDKVPVLGSLPLLGRLFRSTSESTVKRNLLIFVTARLVTTDAPIRLSGQPAGPAPPGRQERGADEPTPPASPTARRAPRPRLRAVRSERIGAASSGGTKRCSSGTGRKCGAWPSLRDSRLQRVLGEPSCPRRGHGFSSVLAGGRRLCLISPR